VIETALSVDPMYSLEDWVEIGILALFPVWVFLLMILGKYVRDHWKRRLRK